MDITRSPDEERPQFSKINDFDMIIICIGILIYPVKDSAERSIVFSKYSLKKIFRIPINSGKHK